VVLALLAVLAITLEVAFSMRQRLTPQRFEQARTLWQEKGPADYNVKYSVTRENPSGDRYLARVRNGHFTVELNGAPLDPELYPFHDLAPLFEKVQHLQALDSTARDLDVDYEPPPKSTGAFLVQVRHGRVVAATWDDEVGLPPGLYESHTMPALLAAVGRYLELDARPGQPSVYLQGMFDPGDGHLVHYVRSVRQTRERIQFDVIDFHPVSGT
jgi:hypothetical protein